MNASEPLCYQINLQLGLGGGEIYTRFLSEALAAAGWRTVVFVHPRGRLREELGAIGVATIDATETQQALHHSMQTGCPVVVHGVLKSDEARILRSQGRRLFFLAHMPVYGRNPEPYLHCDRVIPVSAYVRESLLSAGIAHVHPEPLLGVADLERRVQEASIVRHSCYSWDPRKLRDRLLGATEPIWNYRIRAQVYRRRPGTTLGIVSRLTPIKQFPLFFKHCAGALSRIPEVHIEVFGSGGYASVRDLRKAARPIRARLRFWGDQRNVRAVYAAVDYLLTGLPEKEALGLNVIEAQVCGVPVLAVGAKPFTETVAEGVTGWFFKDPRLDAGADLAKLLQDLVAGRRRLRQEGAQAHLAKFSRDAFNARIARLVASW